MLRTFGSLWAKNKDGKRYLSGELEFPWGKVKINVFTNDKKEKENQPDYRITYSLDDGKQYQGKSGGGLPGLDDMNAGGSSIPSVQLEDENENPDGFPTL